MHENDEQRLVRLMKVGLWQKDFNCEVGVELNDRF